MPETLKKFGLSGIGISLIAGIVLTILAPYNTNALPFLGRLLYWTGLCFAGSLGATAFEPLVKKLGMDFGKIWLVLGQSLFASIVVILFLIGLNLFQAQTINGPGTALLFFYIWVIAITITGVAHMAENAASKSAENLKSRPAILERVKPSLRSAEIYALSAEDHYVRVFTSKGEDLILMRLSDAIKEAAPITGLLVHRSWWVAEAGAQSVKKSDGKLSIQLPGGQIAPVSRSNAKLVREAGWA